jgi:hypothetical protein
MMGDSFVYRKISKQQMSPFFAVQPSWWGFRQGPNAGNRAKQHIDQKSGTDDSNSP